MGVYYRIVCHSRRECIEPGSINNLGIKLSSITHPSHPIGTLAVFALVDRNWDAVSLVSDGTDLYDEYSDVTRELIEAFNAWFKDRPEVEPLRFTGDS
jgi:hypothetical protein